MLPNMKKLGHLVLILLVLALSNSLNAQNVEFKKGQLNASPGDIRKAKSEIKIGDEYYLQGHYYYKDALRHYLIAQQVNPNNALLNFKIGYCYIYSPQKAKSLEHFKKAQTLDPKFGNVVNFALGWGYHVNLDWDNAIKHYKMYRETVDSKNIDELKLVDKRIAECENGRLYTAKPVRVLIENIGNGVNTIYPEYSPVISADESTMFFTSRRDNTTGREGKNISAMDEQYYEDIYRAAIDPNNKKWANVSNLGRVVNTVTNDATVNLSPDGQRLLIYKDKVGGGDIFESVLSGTEWTEPKPLGKTVNTGSYETHASYSFDGRILYFVSDRPYTGYGGKDIYYCYIDDKGNLGEAINMGPEINTQFDEDGIYAHPDGKTLYFASQGHTSMGGYDIFKSELVDGKWSRPINLGFPINSADDDVFFVVSADNRHAYFSSFKLDGFGEKDIYRLTFLGDEKQFVLSTEDNLLTSLDKSIGAKLIEQEIEVPTGDLTILKGVIYDKITKKPLGGTVEIVDLETNSLVSTFPSNTATGKYLVSLPAGKNYSVTASADGYLFKSENFNIPAASGYQEVERDFPLDRIDVGRKIVLKNIFFDFNKYTLRAESASELERLVKLLKKYPALRIEISGHTDNVGSETYNKTLSENRAKVVVDYLITNGIDKSRLVFVGYGFSQPIASNDIDEGRQLNRRTEFKVLAK